MISAAQISSYAPYYGVETTLVEDHSIPDIMRGIEQKHQKEKRVYDTFSEKFWRGSTDATCRYIFDFLMKNVRYEIESPEEQTVKSPGAIVGDRFGDCKHYASFANGVLASLQRKGYPVGTVTYRYAGYYPHSNDLHHVFSVVKNGGREIWIDPVIRRYNDKSKKYYVSKDVDIMPLKEISGVPEMGNIFTDIKKGFNNTVTAVTRGAQNTAKKVVPAVLKVGAATGRNAFLVLLKVNAFNIAHRLYDFSHRSSANAAEMAAKWKSLGGDPDSLKKNVTEGMNAYLSRHKQSMADYNKQKGFIYGMPQPYQMFCFYFPYHMPGLSDGKQYKNAVGVDPATAATLMTAAAAIIAAMAPILKKAGWSEEDKKNAQNITNAGAAALSYGAATTTDGNTFGTGTATFPNGTSENLLTATVDTTADGTKMVTVKDTGTLQEATGGSITETMKQWFDSAKSFVIENKLLVGGTIATILVIKSGILAGASTGTKKRK